MLVSSTGISLSEACCHAGGGNCNSDSSWVDDSEEKWTCNEYELYCSALYVWDSAWGEISDWPDEHGLTAVDACCSCRLRTPEKEKTDNSGMKINDCANTPLDWYDNTEEGWGCQDYAPYCQGFAEWNSAWGDIEGFIGLEGKTAYDACCACGGGKHINITSTTSTNEAAPQAVNLTQIVFILADNDLEYFAVQDLNEMSYPYRKKMRSMPDSFHLIVLVDRADTRLISNAIPGWTCKMEWYSSCDGCAALRHRGDCYTTDCGTISFDNNGPSNTCTMLSTQACYKAPKMSSDSETPMPASTAQVSS